MIKHIDRWLSFTRRLELGIEMEDIILVTGCHRTRSWASVVFSEDPEDAQVSFGVEVTGVNGPNTNINWRFSPENSGGAVVNWGPDGRVCDYAICTANRAEITRASSIRIYPRINAYLYEDSVSLVPSGFFRDILSQQRDPLRTQAITTQNQT
jgi:hypothetical protein